MEHHGNSLKMEVESSSTQQRLFKAADEERFYNEYVAKMEDIFTRRDQAEFNAYQTKIDTVRAG